MPLADLHLPVPGHQDRGDTPSVVMHSGFDPLLYRPYFDKNDRPCVTINTGRWTVERGERRPIKESRLVRDVIGDIGYSNPVLMTANATALRKEDWIQMDQAVLLSARQRLAAAADLRAANSFGGFNGMAKMTLEYEAMSDPGEAVVDMDAMTEGRTDNPLFKLRSLPLFITHSDFWFSQRRLEVSRNSTALDTTMAEAAGRRVGEKIERLTIGVDAGITYGTETAGYGAHDGSSTSYGYANFTARLTKTNMAVPTGTNPNATLADVLAMRNQLYAQRYYGPFMLYHSTDWDTFLDNDYYVSATGAPYQTLRDRIRAIEGISNVRRLDFLTSTYTMLMVQMTSDVARMVVGMDITTVQWPSMGGMRQNYKVMTIQVPQLRSDYSGRTGILHGTTA